MNGILRCGGLTWGLGIIGGGLEGEKYWARMWGKMALLRHVATLGLSATSFSEEAELFCVLVALVSFCGRLKTTGELMPIVLVIIGRERSSRDLFCQGNFINFEKSLLSLSL